MPLAKGLEPLEPPAHVWQAIRRRLHLSPSAPDRRWTRTLAIAASVLLVVALGTLVYWRLGGPERATALATISAPSGAQVWTVEIYAPPGESGRITLHSGDVPPRPPDRDYELWALPKGGSPVSLGVLPSKGFARHVLSPAQKRAVAGSIQIAVSIEPTGGSPTGQPTGAIVFVAPLRAVS